MAIRDRISLKEILLGFENTLRIEYKERDIEKIIENSRYAIENAYQVKLVSDIFETQIANRMLGDSLNSFFAQLTECMKSMSLVLSLSLFDREYIKVSLADANYLGFASAELLTALKYLQNEKLYEQRNTFLAHMKRNASNLDLSLIKRQLTIMFVLESLGVREGVALFAQYLYAGAQ